MGKAGTLHGKACWTSLYQLCLLHDSAATASNMQSVISGSLQSRFSMRVALSGSAGIRAGSHIV